jgi:hypothetical protein
MTCHQCGPAQTIWSSEAIGNQEQRSPTKKLPHAWIRLWRRGRTSRSDTRRSREFAGSGFEGTTAAGTHSVIKAGRHGLRSTLLDRFRAAIALDSPPTEHQAGFRTPSFHRSATLAARRAPQTIFASAQDGPRTRKSFRLAWMCSASAVDQDALRPRQIGFLLHRRSIGRPGRTP